MRIYFAFLFLGLIGCQAVKYIGATPIEDHNNTVAEVQKFTKESMENQAVIGDVTIRLSTEDILDAKKDNDEVKLERAIETKVIATQATKKANDLSKTEYTVTKDAGFDLSGFLDILTGVLSTMFPVLGGYLLMMRNQLGRVKEKARIYATTPETFDIKDDKDLK